MSRKKWPKWSSRHPLIRRILWACDEPATPQDERGLAAEKKAAAALRFHQAQRTVFSGGRIIVKVEPQSHFSPFDSAKVDVLVHFQTGERAKVQVKNFWNRDLERRLIADGFVYLAIWSDDGPEQAQQWAEIAMNRLLDTEPDLTGLILI